MIQGSDEWFQARVGKVTASRIADVMAKTKSGYGAGRANYMAELVAERLTGESAPSFTNAAMQWGTEKEPEAREFYEFLTSTEVVQVGFIDHPRIDMSGASPDGLVGDDGMVEIKCPNTATHIEFLRYKKPKDQYVKQVQWQMACTDREWTDFVSFDPRLPHDLQLRKVRIERDNALISTMEEEVEAFLEELENIIVELREV